MTQARFVPFLLPTGHRHSYVSKTVLQEQHVATYCLQRKAPDEADLITMTHYGKQIRRILRWRGILRERFDLIDGQSVVWKHMINDWCTQQVA